MVIPINRISIIVSVYGLNSEYVFNSKNADAINKQKRTTRSLSKK
jgi:hypothetical protein